LVIIDSNETPYQGFKKLIDNNILSAPVKVHHPDGREEYTGFLDMRNLVSFVVYLDDDQKFSNAKHLHSNPLEALITHGCKVFKLSHPVSCSYLSRLNPFVSVKPTESLLRVTEILSVERSTGLPIRRVAVMDDSGNITNIISQTSILKFLHDQLDLEKKTLHHKGPLGNAASKTIAAASLGTSPVLTVNASTKAIDAFKAMEKHGINGLAVVDDAGRFVGNTSASDMKLFVSNPSLELLEHPIMQFLNVIRNEAIEARSPTISCKPTDTVAQVIEKVSNTKVHRIFVADDSAGFRPTSVISITDVLRYVVKA